VKVSLILTVLIVLMMSRPSDAQTDPCSIEALTSSFQSAALSNEVQTWIDRYELSACSANVIQGARQMARGYSTITSEEVTAGSVIATSWRGMGVQYDGTGYVEVALDLSYPQDEDLRGTMSIWEVNDNEPTSFNIRGDYFTDVESITDRSLWNRLLSSWNTEDVVLWFSFRREQMLSGEANMDNLTIGIIKSNGEMRLVVYNPIESPELRSQSILIGQDE